MDSNQIDAAFQDSRFTAEISKRMQVRSPKFRINAFVLKIYDAIDNTKIVILTYTKLQVPDKISIGGSEKAAGDNQANISRVNTQEDASLKMQVPDRILVAGGNSHIAAKNLPRELQLENTVLTPSPEKVILNCTSSKCWQVSK